MEKKLFWVIFIGLGLLSDWLLPFFWAIVATIPIAIVSWWIVYKSGWI